MHPLDGVWLKVRRGRKHMYEAGRLIKGFRKAKPYAVQVEFDPQSGDKSWKVDGDPSEPSMVLSAIVGDAIYNFRSALDHLAWQLVSANGRTPSRSTAFPICEYPSGWTSSSTKGKIKGMSTAAKAIIEAEQPCFSTHLYRRQQFLWLDELCNVDKHRHLHLTQAAIEGGLWSPGLPMTAVDEVFIHSGRVENGTVVALVPRTYAYVDFYPAVDIAFGQGTQAEGEIVYGTLFSFGFLVQNTVRLFNSFFPTSTTPKQHRFDIWES